jgi:predicted Zn-dependent protease
MEAEPAPAPAAPAAPAALPSTTQGPGAGREAACQDVDACAHASMQAAWRADIDTVRQLAARMEGLSKPELGNKAQSRKLNNQALEALKAGDAAQAVPLLQAALKENPRDVEVAGNLGYALVKAQRPQEAVAVLSNALVLDPRRTATWGPLGEALAAAGRPSEAAAALWTAWQWSGNREKTEAVFLDRAEKESATRPAVAAVYRAVHAWVTQGQRPAFKAI